MLKMKEVNIIRNHELEANISGYPTYEAKDGDWLYNYYAVLPALPEVKIEESPVCTKITRLK